MELVGRASAGCKALILSRHAECLEDREAAVCTCSSSRYQAERCEHDTRDCANNDEASSDEDDPADGGRSASLASG